MAPFVINASSTYFQRLPVNLPTPLNCSEADPASRSLDIGDHRREELSDPCGLARCRRHLVPNTCDGSAEDKYREAAFPRSSDVGKCRFLLALHETNARLEGAADTSIFSPSLNTGSGDDSRAGSHELPGYLGVIGGSIHSFHDEDEDLQSLEFASPQEEEPQPQPQEDIPGSGGDGGHLA
ncbi:hypothetical protein TRAPUB_2427 [Trametes pubescens]|uniref:Uncharacterized protein n=1 Tax=Trametes pubescens TaxID=154538 RepID=A0A1M2VGL9_TRAPU|nr:hypothetical protein TRAPUB_2427 [Trametes pubescens]